MKSATLVALALLCSACRSPAGFHGTVATPTGQIHVRSSGTGPDLVLLHGLGDSGIGWHKVECQQRAAGYRVTVWDALGAGASDLPADGDYRIAAHAARVGGGDRAAHELRRPDPDHGRRPPAVHAARLAAGRAADVTEGGVAGAGWRRHKAKDLVTFGKNRTFVLQERQLLPEESAARDFAAGHKAIHCPTLILWGEQDRILPAVQGERLAADIPGARRVVLPGVGHAAQLEAPERFLQQVLPFLPHAPTWPRVGT